ncbi:MAG: serine hydrolase [Deltaproteobacteria bacterium]|nr:serine hydrolase [Deltaproteobacteria bacterium]
MHPRDLPWPGREWLSGDVPLGVDEAKLSMALDLIFTGGMEAQAGATQAFVVVHRGLIVVERYGEAISRAKTLKSWSLAKSFLNAVVGTLVEKEFLQLDGPLGLVEWAGKSDFRSAITVRHLLNMSSGLDFNEDHGDRHSDSGEMLWGKGAQDMGAFAMERPLVRRPGSHFRYSSGDSLILSTVVKRVLEENQLSTLDWMQEHILDPLGMTSAIPRFDPSGTFIGSSYLFACAQDFARLGYLYLRGGHWNDCTLLTESWVNFSRTPSPAGAEAGYGAHFWLTKGSHGLFFGDGFEGQKILIDPTIDLVVVRLGKTDEEQHPSLQRALALTVSAFSGL